jgi:hypothetical protein
MKNFWNVQAVMGMPDVDYGTFGSRVAINPPGSYEGPTLVSAASIQITRPVHKVSGTVSITTILPPYPGFVGHITLIPLAAMALGTGGNVTAAFTGTANKMTTLYFDGAMWFTSAA